jgi:hypothetical protein
MRRAATLTAALALLLVLGDTGNSHGLGQRYDLPLPLGYFLLGAGAAVAVSFVILALFSGLHAATAKSPRQYELTGHIPAVLVLASRIIGAAALLLVMTAGYFGNQATFKNIAPVAVWVICWVGFGLLSAFVGNLWVLINPWTALFDLFAGGSLRAPFPYPRRLGAWPACALFLIFAWLELVAPSRDLPRNIAVAVTIYSLMTFAGFALFGRDVWLKAGEAFSIAFDLLGRFAPLRIDQNRRWRWRLRPYGAGLVTRRPLSPSMTAFTLLLLATVTVDGLMETPLWVSLVENLLSGGTADIEPTRSRLLSTALLLAGPLVLGALYLGTIAAMARLTHKSIAELAGLFVLSLVPIAIAYHLAHYISLLLTAGQFIIPLASDPFGRGWDLFGTTLYRIDIGIVDAQFVWYLSVVAIVTGHIVAVWAAHVTAFMIFPDFASARRSQYPMLVLMVFYTMLSLWIVAQPIVEVGTK